MSRSDRIMVAAGGGALVLALAAALGPVRTVEGARRCRSPPPVTDSRWRAGQRSPASAAPAELGAPIVVDVQGGVAEPGVRELPAGSRVADAIAAAGGYATDADLAAAATAINLAQALTDGEQIRVPRIGDTSAAGAGGPRPTSRDRRRRERRRWRAGDLNTATPEELEALPGIGPVTVQKIVAARQEQPFASLEDAVQRGVINRGQLEDIQAVATAG